MSERHEAEVQDPAGVAKSTPKHPEPHQTGEDQAAENRENEPLA